MLIKFEIQLDGSGTATVTKADEAVSPTLAAQKRLGTAYVAPSSGAQHSVAKAGPGGDQILPDTGTGAPKPSGSGASGSGMVFAIGPIVICGSGPGHTGTSGTGPGGDQVLPDTSTS